MNFDDMQLFVRVVEHGSFTRAADYCGIPKSTLSRRISELEKNLNVRLLHRTTRHFTLTELGEKFYERALSILHEVKDTQLMLDQQKEHASGRLRFFSPVMFNSLFTREITEFCLKYPQLVLELRTPESSPNDVSERRFDLLLNPGELQDSTLIGKRVAQFQSSYYASPAYLKRAGNPESPEQIATHDQIFLSFQKSDSLRWKFDDGESQQWLELSPKFIVDSPEFALRLTEAGLGITQLPKMLANPLVQQGALQPLFNNRFQSSTPVYAVYHDRRFSQQKIRLMLSYLEQTMQKNIDTLESATDDNR